MIVAVSLRLDYVLVDRECVPVVHVAELVDEFVHDAVVPELLLVDHVRLLLDDVVESHSVRQLELVVVLEAVHPHTLLLDLRRRVSGV